MPEIWGDQQPTSPPAHGAPAQAPSRPPSQEPPRAARSGGGAGDLFAGAGYLARGIGWTARNPALWLFGLIPAAITLVLYTGVLVALGFYADDLAAWMTPFADGWSEGARTALRLIAGLALFGAAFFFGLITFTAVTLLVGEPFYERIAVAVEEAEGGAPPEVPSPLLAQLLRAVKDALALGAVALVFAVLFFALGFIPGIGQTVVPVVAACVSGYFLAGELTSIALDRRGIYRKERLALLKRNRWLAVGFGAATVVLFLIPLGAVMVMPGAVAGGTLLVRERLAPSGGHKARAVPVPRQSGGHPPAGS